MICKKILNNNQQCKAFAQNDSAFCFRHDPVQKEKALIASQKGGENRQLKGIYGGMVKIESPDDIKKFLSMVINAVWADGVPVQVGSTMGFLARCWLDAHEASDINKRLDEIEQKVSNGLSKVS